VQNENYSKNARWKEAKMQGKYLSLKPSILVVTEVITLNIFFLS
jgi:hypothetical protein